MKLFSRFRVAALCALGGVFLALLASVGPVQRAVSQGMQQITNLTGTEQISLNYPCTVSCFVTTQTLSAYGLSIAGGNNENALVGGDATTNLFQRGTSVALASPAAVAYTADRWFAWGGTNTPITVTKQTGATDITQDYGASIRVNKPSGAGVVPICIGQEVETVNSIRFQGQVTEFDFHAKAGAGFSAASSNLAVYVLTGTGTDEGSVNGAFSINAGGGGASGWTGAAVLGGTTGYLVPITTSFARYTVVFPIPATATEIAVAVCYTPVGTGGATDWFEFTGAQLVPNVSLTTQAGTAGAVLAANAGNARAFLRRPVGVETDLQQRYAYAINEGTITAGSIILGGGTALGTSTTCSIEVRFPTTMRAAPTYTNALSATTFKLVSASQAATALSTPFSATLGANTPYNASINFTTTGMTAKDGCELVSAAGSGQMLWSAEL
jgi:hypothetical protein